MGIKFKAKKMARKLEVGTERYIQKKLEKWLKNKGFKIIPKKERNKTDEKDWDIVAYEHYKRKYPQRKYYFEIKGKSSKKASKKRSHQEVAILRGLGQLLARLKMKTKWWRIFVLVIPEEFEVGLRSKVKDSYGWKLLGEASNLKVWIVNNQGIPKKCLTYSRFLRAKA